MINYVIEFEICSFFVLFLLALRFFRTKKYPSKKNKWFGCIIVSSLVDIFLDVFLSLVIMDKMYIPLWCNYFLNSLFYLAHLFILASLLIYILYLCGVNLKKKLLIAFIPVFVCTVLIILNLFFNLLFRFEMVDGKLIFSHEPLFPILYANCVVYFGIFLYYLIKYRKVLQRNELNSLIIVALFSLTVVVVQIHIPELLLTGVAYLISILSMYISMQNPESYFDHVSHVYNYNAMKEFFDNNGSKEKSIKMYLCIIDIGGMRRVNNVFGFQIGNKVIRDVADFLCDIHNDSKMIFQLIGTKFLIVFEDKEEQLDIINKIMKRFQDPWYVDSNVIELISTIRYMENPCSFSSCDEVDTFIDTLFSNNAVTDYGSARSIDSSVVEKSIRFTNVVDAIRKALDCKTGFSLSFQPIFDCKANKFSSAEVLLRLNDPVLGAISPAEFIPIAEKSGLIYEVDILVLEMTSKFIKKHLMLKNFGFELFEINLSAAEFNFDPAGLMNKVHQSFNLKDFRICFEVTETAATIHASNIKRFMEDLSKEGFLFAIDDFGTGYANISTIANLPFAIAKIDRSFIVSDSAKDIIVLKDTLTMFHNLGMKIVVEGVETEKHIEKARYVNTDDIQGFYFSKPLEEDEFVDFIVVNNRTI